MTPRLDQAKRYMLEAIGRGEYQVGSTLPPVEELAEKAACSPGTLHSALTELSRAGIIQRVRRKGTVVLRAPQTRRVCLFLALDPHINQLLQQAVYDTLIRAGYHVDVILNSQERELNRSKCEQLRHGTPAADYFVSLTGNLREEGVKELAQLFPHRVLYGFAEVPTAPDDWHVVMDPQGAARAVAEHLLRLGHRKIAVLCGGTNQETHTFASDAAEPFRHLVEVSGGTCLPHYMFQGHYPERLIRQFETGEATAFWDLQDSAATVTMQRCREMGIRVPEDVSIVGRFDTPWCELNDPPLSSLSIEPQATAAAILDTLQRIDRGAPAARIRLVTPRLIARGSTAPLKRTRA
ncbi:MAG: hypothetical protein AMXMBFR7_44230 [Planctomycetota bacterium]